MFGQTVDFQQAEAFGFLIYGHSYNTALDNYNINFSNCRANFVAGIAQYACTRIVDVCGFGERRPTASNTIGHVFAHNRRIETYGIR